MSAERGTTGTAWLAAAHRAAHQTLENGRIFADPLAREILGANADALVDRVQTSAGSRGMRLFIAARSRIAEDALAAAVAAGTRQLVILGAGLDTYAYRGSLREQLAIFEVDQPAMQGAKRARLTEMRIALPSNLTFVAIDFAHEDLMARLSAAGFDRSKPGFFTCLGVTPYVPEPGVWSMLEAIAALPGGAQLVFDYAEASPQRSREQQALHEERAARVAALGEPWITFFDPEALGRRLAALGFTSIEDSGTRAIFARFSSKRPESVADGDGHIVVAACGAATMSRAHDRRGR